MIPEDDDLRRAEGALPADLAAALAAARQEAPPAVPAALMARVLADAAAAQPRPRPDPAPVPRAVPRGAFAPGGLLAAIGRILRPFAGLGAFSTAALAAGLWVGIAQPGAAPDYFALIGLGLEPELALLPDHGGLADFLDPEAGG